MRLLLSCLLLGFSAYVSAADGKRATIDELSGDAPLPSQSGNYRGTVATEAAIIAPGAAAATPGAPPVAGGITNIVGKSGTDSAGDGGSGQSGGQYGSVGGIVNALSGNSIHYRFGLNGGYNPSRAKLLLLDDPSAPPVSTYTPYSSAYTLSKVAPGASLFGGGAINLKPYFKPLASTTKIAMVSARPSFAQDMSDESASSVKDRIGRWIYVSSGGDTIDQYMMLLGFKPFEIHCALFGDCGIPASVYAYMALNRSISTVLNPVPYSVITLAGAPLNSGYTNGLTPVSVFGSITGITTDGTQLYVTDKTNGLVRSISSETTTTLTYKPVFVPSRIKPAPPMVISRDVGVLTSTVAGSLTVAPPGQNSGISPPSSSVDGAGRSASFFAVNGLAFTRQALYVTDGAVIRQVDLASRAVRTISGSFGKMGYVDGAAALFGSLGGIATDGTDLYVGDTAFNVIRRVSASTGAASTLAGSGSGAGYADGPADIAQFNNPTGIATDGTSVFVADAGNNVIRRIDLSSGAVSTLAGKPGATVSVDGVGPAATFSTLSGMTIEGDRLFVADGNLIRRIWLKNGSVTTIAGSISGFTDAVGIAAQFSSPTSIVSDGADLYVTDGNAIRVIIGGSR